MRTLQTKGAVVLACAFAVAALYRVAYAESGNSPKPTGNPVSVKSEKVQVMCANLVYARNKTSKCFSDEFLNRVRKETNITPNTKFQAVRLSSDDLFNYPFAIMTGQTDFTLLEQERINLRAYLTRGGFLLASAGCSSKEWNRSFRREIKRIFPDIDTKKIPMDHKIFSTVFDIRALRLKKSKGSATLEGLELDGRLVMIYSQEGLNDTPNAGKGCCCCGGNEIQNSQEINVNVFAYSLTH